MTLEPPPQPGYLDRPPGLPSLRGVGRRRRALAAVGYSLGALVAMYIVFTLASWWLLSDPPFFIRDDLTLLRRVNEHLQAVEADLRQLEAPSGTTLSQPSTRTRCIGFPHAQPAVFLDWDLTGPPQVDPIAFLTRQLQAQGWIRKRHHDDDAPTERKFEKDYRAWKAELFVEPPEIVFPYGSLRAGVVDQKPCRAGGGVD